MLRRALILTAIAVCLTASLINAQIARDRGNGVESLVIDIMPNHCPNIIQMFQERQVSRPTAASIGPHGLLVVAVAGQPSLNAAVYNPESAQLEGVSPTRYSYTDVIRTDFPDQGPCDCRTGPKDGLIDLILYFSLPDVMAAIGPIHGTESRELELMIMESGNMLYATQCVVVNGLIEQGAHQASVDRPVNYDLRNYPNPFNAGTVISFDLVSDGDVSLDIYDVLGRHVTTLVDGFHAAGSHLIEWDGTDERGRQLGSGMYFYRISSAEYTATQKMTLLR